MSGKWLMQVGEKSYPLKGFMDLSLDAIDELEEETGMTVSEVEDLWESDQNPALTKAGRMATRVRVWVCRRAAGETVTVAEAAAGVPLSDLFVHWDGPDALPDPTSAEEAASESDDSTD